MTTELVVVTCSRFQGNLKPFQQTADLVYLQGSNMLSFTSKGITPPQISTHNIYIYIVKMYMPTVHMATITVHMATIFIINAGLHKVTYDDTHYLSPIFIHFWWFHGSKMTQVMPSVSKNLSSVPRRFACRRGSETRAWCRSAQLRKRL